MKYCMHCGVEMPDAAVFCGNCGKAVNKVSGANPTKKPLIVGCSIGIVLLSIVVVSLFATGSISKEAGLHTMVGSEKQTGSAERRNDVDYTVVAVRDCPEDFLKELEEKKINPFQMTYMNGEYLYIALGYGEQATGGFSISIRGLYELGEKLCLETELLGPGKDETVKEQASYPYIIVKTEKTDKEILFE